MVETMDREECVEEKLAETMMDATPMWSKKTPQEQQLLTLSTGSGKGNLMHKNKLLESMNSYLERFRQFLLQEYGTPKMKEGASTRVNRVKSFLHIMSLGKGRLHEWAFLYDITRIKEWIHEMRNSGKEITTVQYYIHTIAQFLE